MLALLLTEYWLSIVYNLCCRRLLNQLFWGRRRPNARPATSINEYIKVLKIIHRGCEGFGVCVCVCLCVCVCAYQGAFLLIEYVSLLFVCLLSLKFWLLPLNHHHPIATTTTSTSTYSNHTVQIARAQVEYVRQWVEGKRLPAKVVTGGTTTSARTVCANGWRKNATSANCSQSPPPCVQVDY